MVANKRDKFGWSGKHVFADSYSLPIPVHLPFTSGGWRIESEKRITLNSDPVRFPNSALRIILAGGVRIFWERGFWEAMQFISMRSGKFI